MPLRINAKTGKLVMQGEAGTTLGELIRIRKAFEEQNEVLKKISASLEAIAAYH